MKQKSDAVQPLHNTDWDSIKIHSYTPQMLFPLTLNIKPEAHISARSYLLVQA